MSIDRYELIKRHNPIIKNVDINSPLSVGNGEFAFTVDVTGLQTFTDCYKNIPLCTQSQWGWHSYLHDGNEKYTWDKLKLQYFDVNGRQVGYPTSSKGQEDLFHNLRQSPHKTNLINIAFDLSAFYPPSSSAGSTDIIDKGSINQQLDMWRGNITSQFSLNGCPVTVNTCCHPEFDAVAVKAQSQLFGQKLKILFSFPYGSHLKNASDWDYNDSHSADRHTSKIIYTDKNYVDLLRIMDNERYFVRIALSDGSNFSRQGENAFAIEAQQGNDEISFTCMMTPVPLRQRVLHYDKVEKASAMYWAAFWSEGGAIELAESTDKGAIELERRIVLSQYLTAIQCAGSLPPQETGLTYNSWYGKFHLEMHYWHAAHFPLWNRSNLLEKSLWWYTSIMDKAEKWAHSQGYEGVRWPKMTSYEGLDSPSAIGPLLIWQQPHPIVYAELCYRANPSKEIINRYSEIVFKTADFMASYVAYDKRNDRYVLGPALIPAQENHHPDGTLNPTFELEYWKFGLEVASLWRKRMGLPENTRWKDVINKLSKLPEKDGVYLAHENCPDTFTKFNFDHPSMLCALGVLPGSMVDKSVMKATLDRVLNSWDFDRLWGWDFPVMAMTATRLGQPQKAVDALLMDAPKNIYLPNGHNMQGGKDDLYIYLPGNGGLLIATAMMAAGCDGNTYGPTPGFPKNGNWKVTWESINPLL